jgi:hypothetical protein
LKNNGVSSRAKGEQKRVSETRTLVVCAYLAAIWTLGGKVSVDRRVAPQPEGDIEVNALVAAQRRDSVLRLLARARRLAAGDNCIGHQRIGIRGDDGELRLRRAGRHWCSARARLDTRLGRGRGRRRGLVR